MYDDPALDPPSPAFEPDDDLATLVGPPRSSPEPPHVDRISPDSPVSPVCPFLQAIDEDDVLLAPVEAPDPANRCVASNEPVPQSLRQQELVCLTSGHVNCPRYLRGSVGPVVLPVRERTARGVTPATTGSLAMFALAFLVSVGFAVGNGGLALTAAVSTPTTSDGVAAVATTPLPTAVAPPTPTVTPTPTATPTPTPEPTPTATPSQMPTASPSPSPSPTATPRPTPRPTSGRYALLKPCPDASNCWIYVIRSGDNLYSIARYFGVSLSTVRAMNPWTANGLKIGRELRIPTPGR